MSPSEKVYTSLYNVIPVSSSDASARERFALQILLMMKDDELPPYEICEGLIRTNFKPTPDPDFEFFFGLFARNNYRPDAFFVNAFMETLAVRMELREPAYQLMSQLVTDAHRAGGEKYVPHNISLSPYTSSTSPSPSLPALPSLLSSSCLYSKNRLYDANTFEVLVRAFTIADEFDQVMKTFQLWTVSSLKFVESKFSFSIIVLAYVFPFLASHFY